MPGYAVGPPAKPVGPIVDVYADGALERACGNCGAEVNSWCVRLDGSFKPVPCCARLRGGNAADEPTGAQRGAEGQESPSGDNA
jgi:hypothetical protein